MSENNKNNSQPASQPRDLEGETTTNYNDADIADLAKLTALNARGDHMQFSLGSRTEVRYGNKPAIVKGIMTLDCGFLGLPQFRITRSGNGWMFTNCCSTNYTYINSKPVEPDAKVPLENRSLIRICDGTRSQVFVFEDSYDEHVEWKSFLLTGKKKPITIYSSDALRQMSSPSVERKPPEEYPHAIFINNGTSWTVQDVNINRGITINGNKISGSGSFAVYDVIGIGSTIFVYLPGRLVYNLPSGFRKNLIISIAERKVRSSWRSQKILLKDIGLTIEPGQLVLLLGGSGSGKTTFINAVTGYEKADAKVLNGGVDVYENYDLMKYEIGVVPQQDLLRGTDTVYMTLLNAAQLRLPTFYTSAERKERTDQVLAEFGLTSQKNSLVKDLSGGQRKRLSIACEYIGDPSLFILDEPDSGLDGVIARELIERLRKIADSGKIVIVITHTPDRVADLFDHIIVLAKDSDKIGRLTYYGTIEGAKEFFGKSKMEDIVKAVNTKEEGGEGRADDLIARYDEIRRKEEAKNA
ncbi:MAG: ATP-binding cassette domain-containing protein [Solobacterium sp.]|nr:ATP-binding cassette domain-containing protein [Solobacterium sp.]